jgi:MFS family permease
MLPPEDGSDHDAPTATARERMVTVPFVLVTLATFAYFLALGALLPTLPRYVEEELGGGGVAVGVVVGSFAISAALLRPFAGRLGDLRGRRILVVGGSALVGLSVLAYAFVDDIAVLVGLRLITGIGEAAMWVGAATSVQDMAPDDRRGEAASYFSVALYAGLALGPALGEWMLDARSFDAVWVLAGASALVATFFGLWTPPVVPGERQPFRLLHPTAIGPGFVLFLGLLPFIGFSAFIALYGPEVSIDDTAPVFFLYAGLVLVIRVVGARLPDLLGWRRASTGALVAAGVAGLLLAVWGAAPGVWIATVWLSVGMSLLFPALFSATVTAVPPEERGQAVGTFSLFFDLASGVGAPLLGVVVSLASYRASFAVAGVCSLLGLVVIARLAAHLRAAPAPT